MEYRQQGDVLLKLTNEFPKGLKATKGDLLHKGQNHHHRLKGGAFRILGDATAKFLEVKKATKLVHEEHKPIAVPVGKYVIGIVMEYDHWSEESRQVID